MSWWSDLFSGWFSKKSKKKKTESKPPKKEEIKSDDPLVPSPPAEWPSAVLSFLQGNDGKDEKEIKHGKTWYYASKSEAHKNRPVCYHSVKNSSQFPHKKSVKLAKHASAQHGTKKLAAGFVWKPSSGLVLLPKTYTSHRDQFQNVIQVYNKKKGFKRVHRFAGPFIDMNGVSLASFHGSDLPAIPAFFQFTLKNGVEINIFVPNLQEECRT